MVSAGFLLSAALWARICWNPLLNDELNRKNWGLVRISHKKFLSEKTKTYPIWEQMHVKPFRPNNAYMQQEPNVYSTHMVHSTHMGSAEMVLNASCIIKCFIITHMVGHIYRGKMVQIHYFRSTWLTSGCCWIFKFGYCELFGGTSP